MRRLKLEMDGLKVESFEVVSGVRGRGTVRGREYTRVPWECDSEPVDDSVNYCSPPPTSLFSCAYTCGNTCSCGCTRTQGGYTCTCPDDPELP
jgi:hypothetical protein